MTTFSNIAIIYNPNSTGSAQDNARRLETILKQSLPKAAVAMLPTERAGHAADLAYDFALAHKNPLLVSASGDGGYNEVINGAMRAQAEGADPVCAVLPSGNANDHARTMQDSPLSGQIAKGEIQELDLLEVTTKHAGSKAAVRYAHSYVGIGLTPTVAVELNKRTLNSLKEALIIFKTFWKYKPVAIAVEGQQIHIDSLVCSTIPGMAKVLTFSERSLPHDGLFELTVFGHNRKIRLFYRLLKGALRHLGAQARLAEYDFKLLKPAPIQLDGEVMELKGNTDVTIRIRQKLLRTIV